MKIQQFVFNMFGVNCYIIWNEASLEAAIIDPGMIDDAENKRLDDFITSNGLHVIHIINTHLHLDHTFGTEYTKEKYGCPLEGNTDDNILGQNRAAQARMFGIPINLSPLTIDSALNESDTFKLGDETVEILHIPGHSPGSIVLYVPDSGFIISGDVLFRTSIGRTDLAQGDYGQLVNGITKKLLTLPHDTIVYPGHGPSTTIGYEIENNPYL